MLKFIDPSKSYLEAIINSIADPIFVKDEEHRWVFFNTALCSFLGRSKEDLLNKTDYDFFSEKESQVFWEKDELVFKNTGENINEEQITDAKGLTHTIVTKKMLYMDNEAKKYIVGIIRDITEQKTAELKFKERISELERMNAELTTRLHTQG
ncbi:MAG: PAS domain S-box protein [Patescibacteria group bacterium]